MTSRPASAARTVWSSEPVSAAECGSRCSSPTPSTSPPTKLMMPCIRMWLRRMDEGTIPPASEAAETNTQ